MVVPPVVTLPLIPCQVTVQPPHWLPMLSAVLPPSAMPATDFDSGNTPPSFFSTTTDAATACRATARCAAEPIRAVRVRSTSRCVPSSRPISHLTTRMRRAASSMRLCGTVFGTSARTIDKKDDAVGPNVMTMSTPAFRQPPRFTPFVVQPL